MGESLLPLNGFQQMMLRWEQHLPLNAMHLVELKSGPDSRVVADCLSAACSMLGLRRVCVDGAGRNLLWESPLASRTVPAPQVALRSLATAGHENLSRVLNLELNERFESGMHWPVRAVQIEQDNHTTFLGLVYHHLVTDARGISLLMREWIPVWETSLPKGRVSRLSILVLRGSMQIRSGGSRALRGWPGVRRIWSLLCGAADPCLISGKHVKSSPDSMRHRPDCLSSRDIPGSSERPWESWCWRHCSRPSP